MRTTTHYLRFLNTSLGSATEARYLLDLAGRLGYLPDSDRQSLVGRYTHLVKSLQSLVCSLERLKPEA